MTALKSFFFLIFVPGLFVGYIPLAFLLTGSYIETGFLFYLALPRWIHSKVQIRLYAMSF